MNIVLLKGKDSKVDIKTQQQAIIKCAKSNGLSLDITEVESSDKNLILEDRTEFRGFLRSLNHNDNILIYDLYTLSSDVAELTKIFECFLKRSIGVYICNKNVVIRENSPSLALAVLLSKFRDERMNIGKEKSQGRPKGRMSKSKFDIYRNEVINYLSEDTSVNRIANILGVSRTSLKDYINSRGLKELVLAKKTLLESPIIVDEAQNIEKIKNKKCSLLEEQV